jgi:ABC-type multidrug transport system fused ATPase/permease subunit
MIKTIKTFYHFVFRKKLVYILIIVTVVVSSVLQSITPYFFKLFVDAIPDLNYRNLMNILLIYIGISVLALTIDVISGWLGDIVLLDAARDARQEIFKHVQSLDFSFHSN